LNPLFTLDWDEGVEETDWDFAQSKVPKMMEEAGIIRAVHLQLVSTATIHSLNLQYRGQDQPTDILSFGYDEDDEPQGDLVLCLSVAQAQAKEYGLTLEQEVLRLLAHGLVHLLGHDHETEAEETQMLALEKKLLRAIDLEGLYPD